MNGVHCDQKLMEDADWEEEVDLQDTWNVGTVGPCLGCCCHCRTQRIYSTLVPVECVVGIDQVLDQGKLHFVSHVHCQETWKKWVKGSFSKFTFGQMQNAVL